jgi:acyl transferase domain-containing protein
MAFTPSGGLDGDFNAGSTSGSGDCQSADVETVTSASSLFPDSLAITGGKPRIYRVNRHGSHQGGFKFSQEPVAVVGMACRLPDECNSPRALWRFLERGSVARNTPPATRFSLETHHDGSLRRQTMPSPGGMFLQGIDPRDMDAQFFRLSTVEATSMDPQQRQLLEIVYEGFENAGITMEEVDGARVGCFVGSFACDYGDIQARDPEQRAAAAQVGIGRAMLSNRISHFFNLKGPR